MAELPNKAKLPFLYACGLTMKEIAAELGEPWTPHTVMVQRRKLGLPKRKNDEPHWRKLANERHRRVWALFNDGKAPTEIAETTDLSYSYVLRILKKG